VVKADSELAARDRGFAKAGSCRIHTSRGDLPPPTPLKVTKEVQMAATAENSHKHECKMALLQKVVDVEG